MRKINLGPLALTLALLSGLAGPVLAQPGTGPISGGGGGGGLPGANEVTESMLKVVNACTDEYVLTCETTTGDFEWQAAATGTIGGTLGTTDNGICRADGSGGLTAQGSPLTLSDVSGVTTTLATITPAATTGATVAGQALAITASPAVASTDTAGAAAGGSVTITAGAAARNASGNAAGGGINLVTGAGIGTGAYGSVIVPANPNQNLAWAFAGDTDTGVWWNGANSYSLVVGGNGYFTIGSLLASSTNFYMGGKMFYGFYRNVDASTAGVGAPNALGAASYSSFQTNEGTTAKNYQTLFTAAAGGTYPFCVQDADGMRITANTGDTIRVIDKVTAAAGYIESTTIGSCVTLVALNATEWFAESIHGVWTDGTWTFDNTSLTTP